MSILLSSILLIIGFIVLWLSSNKAIIYCSRTAGLFGISKLFIGFIVLAISTGLPELLVAIQSLITHAPQLSVGDIIGSNFVDITMALGISAVFIGPIKIVSIDYYEQLVMFVLSCLVMVFIFINGHISRPMGIALLMMYFVGIIWLWRITHNEAHEQEMHRTEDPNKRNRILSRLTLYLFLVVASSKLCVDSALMLAEFLQIPLDILGVSIFAIGTSLPEIMLNIQAIRQKNYSLALGNSLGSVFSQGAFILGLLAIVSSTPLSLEHLYPIIPFMTGSYALVAFHLFYKKSIGKLSGLILISSYILFIAYQLWTMTR